MSRQKPTRHKPQDPAPLSEPVPSLRQKMLWVILVPLSLLLALEGLAWLFEPRSDLVALPGLGDSKIPAWLARDPAIGETLRHLDRIPKDINREAVAKFWQFYQRDPDLHYRLKPNLDALTVNSLSPPLVLSKMIWRITSNAEGFRGRLLPRTSLPPAEKLVVCLGDSSTYGWGVGENETYPVILESILAKAGGAWTVVNLGHPGFSSFQGRMLAEKLIPLRPAVVTIAFGTNDHSDSGLSDRELWKRDHGALARLSSFAENLALYRLMQRALLSFWNPGIPGPGNSSLVARVPVTEFEDNLRAIAETVRRAGARPVFVFLDRDKAYAQAMTRVAQEARAPFVSSVPIFSAALPELRQGRIYGPEVAKIRNLLGSFLDQNPEYYLLVDTTHPNRIGHELLAENLAVMVRNLAL